MSLSKLQSPMTTKWLYDNYEMSNGVSLPRSSLYNHYLDFCQKNCLQPVNAASFGKIIRHTFPTLKTRRLGTRGQSKYHYYGICVKESSPYHDAVYNSVRQSASGFSQTYSRSELEKSSQATSLKQPACSQVITSSNGILLPDFPSADTVDVHDVKLQDKVKTFLIMYRAHCQRILDTILRANFSEVQHFLLHFWRGMPPHISVILDLKEVIELIAVCDQILYKAMSSVLIPGTLQPLPASLTQAIKQFAKQLCHWLELSLHHVPEPLQDRKLLGSKNVPVQFTAEQNGHQSSSKNPLAASRSFFSTSNDKFAARKATMSAPSSRTVLMQTSPRSLSSHGFEDKIKRENVPKCDRKDRETPRIDDHCHSEPVSKGNGDSNPVLSPSRSVSQIDKDLSQEGLYCRNEEGKNLKESSFPCNSIQQSYGNRENVEWEKKRVQEMNMEWREGNEKWRVRARQIMQAYEKEMQKSLAEYPDALLKCP